MRKLGWYNRTKIERAPRGIQDVHNAAFLVCLVAKLWGVVAWPWWPFIAYASLIVVIDFIAAVQIVCGGPDEDMEE